jgi:hypothetical protein
MPALPPFLQFCVDDHFLFLDLCPSFMVISPLFLQSKLMLIEGTIHRFPILPAPGL